MHSHTHRQRCTHTSIVYDELDDILDLLQSEIVLPAALPLVTMDPRYHSIGHKAGLEARVAHAVEKEEGLLADPDAVVMEDGEGSSSLLLPEGLRREAARHHLTHDN